jgi:prophage DNA circulation protein
MFKADVIEAKPILQRAMKNLLLTVSETGRSGSDARAAMGSLLANLDTLLHDDTIGEPLADCFDLARDAGMTIPGVTVIYDGVIVEAPATLGAKLVKDSLISLCAANGARIIADMTFTSREDVEAIIAQVNAAFAGIEETTADAMDSASYIAMVRLHAATTNYLVTTARPLPRMLQFQFSMPLPTLVAAYRLYADAGRADELRDENKVVHPAFMRPSGVALSN